MNNVALHSDIEYLTDPFPSDESHIQCRTTSIRLARKKHVCWGLDGKMNHTIKSGDKYRYEKALVDGIWGEYHICLVCMDKFLTGEF